MCLKAALFDVSGSMAEPNCTFSLKKDGYLASSAERLPRGDFEVFLWAPLVTNYKQLGCH
jgi:hypothetical protein